MPTIYRSRVVLTGWEGAPGLNTIYWTKGTLVSVGPTEVQNWHDDIGQAWAAVKGYCCDSWTLTVQAQADIIDVESGNITGVVTADGTEFTASQTTGSVSAMSRATQACVALGTDVWANGRRLAGRVFFGPLNTEAFTEAGVLNGTAVAAMNSAFGTINTGTGPRWAVYHRPTALGGDGYYGDVTAINTRTRPAVLRSRRG